VTTQPADLLEFAWIWNQRARLPTPALHRRVLRWLEGSLEDGDRRLLLMAFRGAGKSTLVGLFCAWTLYRAPDTRILVLAADHALATRMVATVRRILARHPLCGVLLPDHAEGGWASDRFTVVREAVLRDASMLAAGISGNITGARAEMIICDDVEVAGNCDTPGNAGGAADPPHRGGVHPDAGRHHAHRRHRRMRPRALYAEGNDAPARGHARMVHPDPRRRPEASALAGRASRWRRSRSSAAGSGRRSPSSGRCCCSRSRRRRCASTPR
jgi:hypothetical protein